MIVVTIFNDVDNVYYILLQV